MQMALTEQLAAAQEQAEVQAREAAEEALQHDLQLQQLATQVPLVKLLACTPNFVRDL